MGSSRSSSAARTSFNPPRSMAFFTPFKKSFSFFSSISSACLRSAISCSCRRAGRERLQHQLVYTRRTKGFVRLPQASRAFVNPAAPIQT